MAYKGTPKPAGSGRRAGVVNKKTSEQREMADALGINPLKILLLIANGDATTLGYLGDIPIQVRAKAAGDACKYLYHQLKSIDGNLSVDVNNDRPYGHLTDQELDDI